MYTRVEISSHWKELVSINCQHTYYTNSVCRDLTILPTDETRRFLRNYFLIYKPLTGGFKLIGNDPKSIDLLRRHHQENKQVKFSFLVDVKKAEFINFTDLSVAPSYQNEVYYYATNTASKSKALPTTKIPTVSQQMRYEVAQPLTNKNVKIKDSFGRVHEFEAIKTKGLSKEDSWKIKLVGKTINLEITPISKKIDANTKKAVYTYSITLFYLNSGYYELLTGTKGKDVFQFYNLPTRRRYFGVIDVFLSDIINAKDKVIINQDFKIEFEKRSTYWRYFLVKDENVIYKNFKFFFQDSPLKTKLLKETKTLNNGKEALIFISEGQLPLKEQMEKNFRVEYEKINLNIEDAKGSIGKGKKKVKLPAPTILSIKPETDIKTKKQKIYSDIYCMI